MGKDETDGARESSAINGLSEFSAANRSWWDSDAEDYHARHPDYLGSHSPHGEFYWCPEMLHEKDVRLLGQPEDLKDASILEIGAGSAPCSRWLANDIPDAFIAAFDISAQMLRHAGHDHSVSLVQADAMSLPYADNAFDVVFSVFGAIPFVEDSAALMKEIARVLKPGGRFVFSITHPMRWIFLDDPGPAGLTAVTSYFDDSGYVEEDEVTGALSYAEQHRTMGDRIAELIDASFRLDRLIEPEWPVHLDQTWGQWSPLRGQLFPGTAIFMATIA
ncbi:SAM-dependent methyltransferase [Corynebacterium deserti GIMN1.010]|uniref:SAM-dependent methyltransferase n=1 Tax=Corynebacterium deserti GIMN1.010 TaxID=931089 RepID=A0A0M4CDR2_9CORY|nr:class I SAM-dependent methyltransferase [Corynebacterium deserti]ALC05728.1 SAM-dependent methyltransferase [Corynebacterium deserti GIMN1.010]